MAGLNPGEVYRCLKPVYLARVLPVIERLPFVAVGGSSADKYKCDVVLAPHFPPELRWLVADLALGGQSARVVLRRLRPRQSIPPHVDAWMPKQTDWRRFQVPIVSHPDVIMRWPDDDVTMHLAPGYLYEVRFDRLHEVIHGADCDRIHLQIDQVAATI